MMIGKVRALRGGLAYAVSLVLIAACAANPERPPPEIDYRGLSPAERVSAPERPLTRPSPAPDILPATPPPPPLLSAAEEARSLRPERGVRPGGPRRLPPDDPAARRIEVRRGDTLSAISVRTRVSLEALAMANGLSEPYPLDVGQVLNLPPPNVHVVGEGETFYSISERFRVDVRSLALLNGLERPWRVWPGDEILLPPLAGQASAIPALRSPAPPAPSVAGAARPGDAFIWPVLGRIVTPFGVSDSGTRSDGVDIETDDGAPVRAAANGEVVFAGDELTGLGHVILIRHAEGLVTAYAKVGGPLVKEGDRVVQGQPVARAGLGDAPGKAVVRFELRAGPDPIDPARRLPPMTR
jgi:murein DD-endopeptidase MepM/ murein hydrolase activator NlpD